MNRRLSERRIRSTYRDLVATQGKVSGRQLRCELKTRFGAVGKTERIFRIWREETGQGAVSTAPLEVRDLQERMIAAEASATEERARAERAEYRERAHQEHWATEVDRLRQAALAHAGSAAAIRSLQEQVLKLSAELSAARAVLMGRE